MEEIWKPIEGYEGLYEVSNYGNIRRLKFVNMYTTKNRIQIIKPQKHNSGYLQIILHDGIRSNEKLVHRLVAEAFIPKQTGKEFVNHKDGNKINNNIDNLEWCTRSENMVHAYKKGLLKPPHKGKFGKDSISAKPIDMLDKYGNVIKRFGSLIEAAHFVGAKNSSGICECCKNRRKTAYGYVWKYANSNTSNRGCA